MDEELKRFWRHHDNVPPIRGPPIDINAREGAKGWDGKPIKKVG